MERRGRTPGCFVRGDFAEAAELAALVQVLELVEAEGTGNAASIADVPALFHADASRSRDRLLLHFAGKDHAAFHQSVRRGRSDGGMSVAARADLAPCRLAVGRHHDEQTIRTEPGGLAPALPVTTLLTHEPTGDFVARFQHVLLDFRALLSR